MKLLRYGSINVEKPGILDQNGQIRDLSGLVEDINPDFLASGGIQSIASVDPLSLPLVEDDIRIGACVGSIGKFLCIGLNYTEHAAESGSKVPEYPLLFQKATSAVIGPNDTVEIPRGSTKTDWEVELGVVIGTRAKYVSEDKALDHVAGYCVVNDVSERHFQKSLSGQWTKGKSCDTFGPTGPWLVTRDDVPDPQALDLYTNINGKRMQTGNTATMCFSVAKIISHLSQLMSLMPGDIIATGTPPGVGMGIKPEPVFLKPGDTMELGISGLGVQNLNVVQG